MDVFNTSKNSTNEGRIYYWKKGVEVLRTYDPIHLIFGNSGYFGRLYSNNAENGWLTLLLNNGLVGFFYYLLPIIAIIHHSVKLKTYHIAYVFVLIIAMMIQTFHLGASASLLYWVIIYSFYQELKVASKNKNDSSTIQSP